MANRIDKVEMMRLLNEGKSPSFIARHFNVSVPAVTAARERQIRKLKDVPDPRRSDLSSSNINAAEQLRDINEKVMGELKRCSRMMDTSDERQIEWEEMERKVRDDPSNKELLKKFKSLGVARVGELLKIQTNLLAISAEVRKQIELQMKIFEMLYNVQMTAEFQEEVIAVLGDVAPSLREKVIKRLKERRSIRGLLKSD